METTNTTKLTLAQKLAKLNEANKQALLTAKNDKEFADKQILANVLSTVKQASPVTTHRETSKAVTAVKEIDSLPLPSSFKAKPIVEVRVNHSSPVTKKSQTITGNKTEVNNRISQLFEALAQQFKILAELNKPDAVSSSKDTKDTESDSEDFGLL